MSSKSKQDPADLQRAIDAYLPRLPLLKKLASNLEARVRELIADVPRVDRISFRAKKPESFAAKSLKRKDDGALKYAHPLLDLEDQVAGRVLVFFRRDMDAVIKALHPVFNTVDHTSKKPEKHTEFAYESDHLVLTIPITEYPDGWIDLVDRPITFELQVRTLAMHAWAEPEHDLTYKPDVAVTDDEKRELAWAASSAWGIDSIFERVFDSIQKRRSS